LIPIEFKGENGVDDQLASSYSMLHPSIFEHVDQQAITVAESEQTSYTELIDQLTYGLLTDLEKAR
jgi:hypothetical protein